MILLGRSRLLRASRVPAGDRAHGLANPFAGATEEGFTIEEADFQIAVLDADRAGLLAGDVRWHPAFG